MLLVAREVIIRGKTKSDEICSLFLQYLQRVTICYVVRTRQLLSIESFEPVLDFPHRFFAYLLLVFLFVVEQENARFASPCNYICTVQSLAFGRAGGWDLWVNRYWSDRYKVFLIVYHLTLLT